MEPTQPKIVDIVDIMTTERANQLAVEFGNLAAYHKVVMGEMAFVIANLLTSSGVDVQEFCAMVMHFAPLVQAIDGDIQDADPGVAS